MILIAKSYITRITDKLNENKNKNGKKSSEMRLRLVQKSGNG